MKNLIFTFIACCFYLTYSIGQEYSQKWSDINYADDGMDYHLLDIYLPTVSKPSYPVVVLVYGSAWFSNNLKGSDMSTLGSALLDAGYAVVTPNHRSSSDAIFPAQIHDIKATIRFIRGNAATYKLDPTFIGITGSSSGGHLAALTGTSGCIGQYTVGTTTMDLEGSVGNYTAYSSRVNAVCDWFGPTDFLIMDACGSSITHNAADSPESSLIGGPIQDNPEKCALANPITYVDPTDPPFLMIHGDADALVPYCNSEVLYEALQASCVQSQFILVPGGQHYTDTHIEENFAQMVELFNSALNRCPANSYIKSTGALPDNNLENGNISIYPNPLKGSNLNVSIPELSTQSAVANVYNANGSFIKAFHVVKGENRIQLTDLEPGWYILKINDNLGTSLTKKFLKK